LLLLALLLLRVALLGEFSPELARPPIMVLIPVPMLPNTEMRRPMPSTADLPTDSDERAA
jgi:hypothetical protein